MDWTTNGEYTPGQCTDAAASLTRHIPAGLGNACDWLANAVKKRMRTSADPVVGAVVVYGRGQGYNPDFGHVAVVEGVQLSGQRFTVVEGNWRELGRLTRRLSTTVDVIGFLPPPNADVTVPAATPPTRRPTSGAPETMHLSTKRAIVRLAYEAAIGRTPDSQATEDWWAGQIADDGSNVDLVAAKITDSPEALARKSKMAEILARG